MKAVWAWTDYPIAELGDEAGKEAPIRRVLVVEYDGDKYCTVEVEGVRVDIKNGYIYKEFGRAGEVQPIEL